MRLAFFLSPVLFLALVACGASHATDDGGETDASDLGSAPDLSDLFDPGGDAGVRDLGLDLGPPDLGSPECFDGRSCDPTRGCNGGQVCQGTITVPFNYTTADGGTGSVSYAYFQDGYCTNAALGTPHAVEGMTGACDPMMAGDDAAMVGRDGCLACAKCVEVQQGMGTTPGAAICLERCTPSATDLGGCRAGYMCDPASHTCSPAQCQSDTQCRLYHVDTNGNGMLDMGDGFRLDTLSTATCDLAVGRCTGGGAPSAHAGDPCTLTSECEAGGYCLSEFESHLPGGYCTRLYCDLPGGACGSGETCRDAGHGLHICLASCQVGNEPASAVFGVGGHGDTCRTGYACFYDEMSAVGVPANGACVGGNYNPITTPNVGAMCTMDSQCWSPHGLGKCIVDSMQDTCTVVNCGGFATDICGTGNHCERVGGFSLCLHECATPDDCAAIGGAPTLGCLAFVAGGPTECWPACQADAQCQTGRTCVGASLTSMGHCM